MLSHTHAHFGVGHALRLHAAQTAEILQVAGTDVVVAGQHVGTRGLTSGATDRREERSVRIDGVGRTDFRIEERPRHGGSSAAEAGVCIRLIAEQGATELQVSEPGHRTAHQGNLREGTDVTLLPGVHIVRRASGIAEIRGVIAFVHIGVQACVHSQGTMLDVQRAGHAIPREVERIVRQRTRIEADVVIALGAYAIQRGGVLHAACELPCVRQRDECLAESVLLLGGERIDATITLQVGEWYGEIRQRVA